LWLPSHTKNIRFDRNLKPDLQEGGAQISHFQNASEHSKNEHKNQQTPLLPSNSREIRRIFCLPHNIHFEMPIPFLKHLSLGHDA